MLQILFEWLLAFLYFPLFGLASHMIQNEFLKYQFEIERSISINLDELSGLNVGFKTEMEKSSICTLQPSFYTEYLVVPYLGLIGSQNMPFTFNNNVYVFELVAGRTESYIILCDTNQVAPKELTNRYFLAKTKRVYNDYNVQSNEIIKMISYGKLFIFGTTMEILFYEFQANAEPEFISALKLPDDGELIKDFYAFNDNILYFIKASELHAYNITNIRSNMSTKLGQFRFYYTNDKSQLFSMFGMKSIDFCDDIGFLAVNFNILAFRQNSDMFAGDNLQIVKTIDVKQTIIQMKRVGRSLVVVTSEGLTEYIFVNDCLDLQQNLVVNYLDLGFTDRIPSFDNVERIEIKGEPSSSHFVILNKVTGIFFVFESGSLKESSHQPYIYTSSDSSNKIVSVDIREEHEGNNQFELTLNIRHEDNQLNMRKLRKNSEQLTCSRLIPTTEVLVVEIQARFCDTEMYNYTRQKQESYSNPVLDPNEICTRTLEIELNFKWPLLLTGIIVIAALSIVIIGLILYICCKKKKSKVKESGDNIKLKPLPKHIKFQNEDIKEERNSECHVESPTPQSTDRHLIRSQSESRRQQGWKNFSVKRGLSIKIPNHFDGQKFVIKDDEEAS